MVELWELRYALNRLLFNRRRLGLLLVGPLLLISSISSIAVISSSAFLNALDGLQNETLYDVFLSYETPLAETELQLISEEIFSLDGVFHVEPFAMLKGATSSLSYAVCLIPESSAFWKSLEMDLRIEDLNGSNTVELVSCDSSPRISKGANLSVPLEYSDQGQYGVLHLTYPVVEYGLTRFSFEAISCDLAAAASGFQSEIPNLILVGKYETAFSEIAASLGEEKSPNSRRLFSGLGVELDSSLLTHHILSGSYPSYSNDIQTNITRIGYPYGSPNIFMNSDGAAANYRAIQNQLGIVMIVDSIPFFIAILFVVFFLNRELQHANLIERNLLKRKGISSIQTHRILLIESVIVTLISLVLGLALSSYILFIMDSLLQGWVIFFNTITIPMILVLFFFAFFFQLRIGVYRQAVREDIDDTQELPVLSEHQKLAIIFLIIGIYKIMIWIFDVSILTIRSELIGIIPSALTQFLQIWITIDYVLNFIAPSFLILSVAYLLSTARGSCFLSRISSRMYQSMSDIISAHHSSNIARLSAIAFCILIVTLYGAFVSSNVEGSISLINREISTSVGSDIRCLLDVNTPNSIVESVESIEGVESAVYIQEYTVTIDTWTQTVIAVDFAKWLSAAYWEESWFELKSDIWELLNGTIILERASAARVSANFGDEITLRKASSNTNTGLNLTVTGFFGPVPRIERYTSGEVCYVAEPTWSFISDEAVSCLNISPSNVYVLASLSPRYSRTDIIQELDQLAIAQVIDSIDRQFDIPLGSISRLVYQIVCFLFLLMISTLGISSLIMSILSNIEKDLIHMRRRGLSRNRIERFLLSELLPPFAFVAIGFPIGILASLGTNSHHWLGDTPALVQYQLSFGGYTLFLFALSAILILSSVVLSILLFLRGHIDRTVLKASANWQ